MGKLPLKIFITIFDWKDYYQIASWMVKLEPNRTNGLSKDSWSDCFQVRSLSKDKLFKKFGFVDEVELKKLRRN